MLSLFYVWTEKYINKNNKLQGKYQMANQNLKYINRMEKKTCHILVSVQAFYHGGPECSVMYISKIIIVQGHISSIYMNNIPLYYMFSFH